MADEYARETGLSPWEIPGGFAMRAGGGDHVTADSATIDPYALLTAKQAALFAGLVDDDGKPKVAVIVNWRNRGLLPVATDDNGNEIRDSRGRPKYRLVDVAKADAKTAARAGQMARRLLERGAPAA